jgi:hypothetical protein
MIRPVASVALILACVSTLASVAAVWVAVWTHRQTGSRLRCDWSHVFFAYTGLGLDTDNRQIKVEAFNEGRSATTIEGWGFVVLDERGRPTDTTLVETVRRIDYPQPSLPYRLDSESSVGWVMSVGDLRDSLRSAGMTRVKPFVRTGTGRRVIGERVVDLSW